MAAKGVRGEIMDRAWENIQKKTFTKWTNSHLRRRFGDKVKPIDDLSAEFEDGLKVFQLINALYDTPIPKHNPAPKMRPHKIDNCVLAVNMMEKGAGIKLNFFKAEHLVDHDTKMILGMVWAVILDYQIKGISVEELSAKEGLLLWCQKKTAGYRDVKVENFHTSWVDGLALCALIHRHRPDLINFDSLSKENKADNLRLAFQVAEEKLGIARLLDVEDIVDVARPDERSIITYISEFFHKFSAQNQQELAARRIAKVTKMTQLNDQLKADYNQKASELKSWIAQQIAQFDDHSFPNNLEGVKEKIGDLVAYRKNTKPDKTATKLQLEQLFNNVSMKLRANNRPAFVPADGHSVADIEADWQRLNDSENNRNNALQKEVRRQERLEAENNRFNVKHANLHQWASTKKTVLDRLEGEKFTTVSQVQSRIQLVEGLNTELDNSKPRLDELEKIANGLVSEKFRDSDAVTSKLADVKQLFDSIRTAATQRRQVLDQELELQQKQEVARKEFARQAQDFATWINDVTEGARDYNFGDSLAEVEAFKEHLDKFSADTQSAAGEKKAALDKADAELKALGVTDNQYTSLTVGDIEQRLGALNGELSKRGDAYNTELERQRLHEAKRHEFANQAKAFADSIANSVATIEAAQGDFDAKTATVQGAHNEAEGDQKLSALHQLDEEMRGLGIVHNPHTTWSYPDLAAKWDEHKKFVAKRLADIAREKLHEAKRHEYTSDAQSFVDYITSKAAAIDGAQGDFDAKIAEVISTHNEGEGEEKLSALRSKDEYMRREGIVYSHATLSFTVVSSRWNAHKSFVANRLEDLKRQKHHEAKRQEFLAAAKAFDDWIDSNTAQINAAQGDFDAKTATVQGIHNEAEGDQKLSALHQQNEGLLQEQITFSHAKLMYPHLETKWNEHKKFVAKRLADIAREKLHDSKNHEFADQAQAFADWLAGKNAEVNGVQGEPEEKVAAIKAIHNEAEGDEKLAAIGAKADELRGLGIVRNPHTTLSHPLLTSRWNAHKNFVANRLEDLAQAGALKERDAANRAAQEKQQQQENLKNEVAKRANALNGWIQTTNETFTEPIVVDSQEGIRELQSAFDGASSEFDSKNGEKDAVLASFAELAAAGITDNALAEIDAAGLTEKWNSLGQARDTRRQELADESKRQDDNEALRVEFANKANGLNEALDKQIADLAGLQGEIEAQLEALNAIKPDNSGLDELRTIDQRVQDAGIRSNSHTSHTLETTAAKYNSLSSSVTEKRKVLEGEIAAKQHSQVAPEQLNEIRECFKQFDKDNRGSLSNYEFKACLSALGESVSDETINNVLKQYGNEENRITQDRFTEFMISRLADSDSETQIVNSFKSLAGDRDYVTADQLSIGFDEETKKYLLTQMPAKEGVDGGYDYVKYAQDIFSR